MQIISVTNNKNVPPTNFRVFACDDDILLYYVFNGSIISYINVKQSCTYDSLSHFNGQIL